MANALLQLYRYHAWANDDLFATLSQLEKDPAALHTALRLMNHAYVVSRIFAGHLTGKPHGYASDNTPETPTLSDLREAVSASDRWYLDYVEKTSPEELGEFVSFDFTDGDRGGMTRQEMVTHVVLHGGIHRGEVGRLLVQADFMPPWDTFAVFLHRSEPERRNGKAKAA